jgi:hypothetical protein
MFLAKISELLHEIIQSDQEFKKLAKKGASQGSLRTASSDAEPRRCGVVIIGEEERRFFEPRSR